MFLSRLSWINWIHRPICSVRDKYFTKLFLKIGFLTRLPFFLDILDFLVDQKYSNFCQWLYFALTNFTGALLSIGVGYITDREWKLYALLIVYIPSFLFSLFWIRVPNFKNVLV